MSTCIFCRQRANSDSLCSSSGAKARKHLQQLRGMSETHALPNFVRSAVHYFPFSSHGFIVTGRFHGRFLMVTHNHSEKKARSFGENLESDLSARFLRVV